MRSTAARILSVEVFVPLRRLVDHLHRMPDRRVQPQQRRKAFGCLDVQEAGIALAVAGHRLRIGLSGQRTKPHHLEEKLATQLRRPAQLIFRLPSRHLSFARAMSRIGPARGAFLQNHLFIVACHAQDYHQSDDGATHPRFNDGRS
jgi:hypothetical protein